MEAARVLRRSVASGRPRAAERATLSRGQLPELGGINRVPPGLEPGDEGRRRFLIVAVSGHLRRTPGAGRLRQPPWPGETKRDGRLTQGEGWGRDQGKQRAAETPDEAGAGRPDTGNKARRVREAWGRGWGGDGGWAAGDRGQSSS